MSDALRGHLAMLAFSALVAGSFALGGLVHRWTGQLALGTFVVNVLGCLAIGFLWIVFEHRLVSADALAFHRDAWDFRNILLVERPNGDFGHTLMRQCLFDAWHLEMLKALTASSEPRVAEIAQKAVKEVTYHFERSADTVIGLGDGTPESHTRMQAALDALWPYVGEAFIEDATDQAMAERGIAPLPSALEPPVRARIEAILTEATLAIPESRFAHQGGKTGFRHTEHLGHMLVTMQVLQRSYPGAKW